MRRLCKDPGHKTDDPPLLPTPQPVPSEADAHANQWPPALPSFRPLRSFGPPNRRAPTMPTIKMSKLSLCLVPHTASSETTGAVVRQTVERACSNAMPPWCRHRHFDGLVPTAAYRKISPPPPAAGCGRSATVVLQDSRLEEVVEGGQSGRSPARVVRPKQGGVPSNYNRNWRRQLATRIGFRHCAS